MSETGRGTLSPERRKLLRLLMREKGLAAKRATAQPEGATIPRRAADSGEPQLSFAQQRMWVLARLEPESPFYNIPGGVHLRGHLHHGAFAAALRGIVERHEALRTTFVAPGEVPVQRIHSSLPPRLPIVDLGALAKAGHQRHLERLARRDARRPFDLERGPMLRFRMARLAAEEHVFLLTLHHAAADGWSLGILVREVAELYAAAIEQRPPRLPVLPIQYADFAIWQRRWLDGGGAEDQLSWWRERLADAPPLELPGDRPRPAAATYRGERLAIELDTRKAALSALARERGATLFMALLAALAALLSRVCGQRDISIGTPIANRSRTELEGLIGFFANTLVMRLNLEGRPSFGELIDRAKDMASAAYGRQDLPFERLVEALAPERDLARTPLFQVLFVLQNVPFPTLELPGLAFTPQPLDPGTSKFDLMLDLNDLPDGLSGAFESSRDLFDRATVARLARTFTTLVDGLLAAPERPFEEVGLLTAAERHQVLAEWAHGDLVDPGEDVKSSCETLDGLVAEQATQTPDAVALTDGTRHLSYAELERRAAALTAELAGALENGEAGPEAAVGIALPRGVEAVVGILGTLRAGAAYLPLDPTYPEARRAFMLEDGGAVRVLSEACPGSSSRAPLPGGEGRKSAPLGLAYLLYTSGSTGLPKGVAMPHGALANLMRWQAERSRPIHPEPPRTLQLAPLAFDVSCQEIFSTWAVGGTLVVVDEDTRRDPRALLRLLERQRVERLFLPFVALRQLAEAAAASSASARSSVPAAIGSALREVITAGEQLRVDPALVSWLGGLGARLENHYGPTESHVVSAHSLSSPAEEWPALPPIGRPIAGVRLEVFDASLRPLPAGVPGELALGGAGLARGYHRRPALTAARFVPSPHAVLAGERLYRSGDLARWLPGGTVEFLGRLDNQVKVRGYRVEPGEVEAALARRAEVAQAVAAVLEVAGDARLIAWVSAATGETADAESLRAALAAELPAYLVPSELVVLEAFPLTPSGKIDRRSLSLPNATGDAKAGGDAPRPGVETRLAEIWVELLGEHLATTLHRGSDFFALGGHSLLATQLISRLERLFGIELPLRALFEDATLAGLAARLAESASDTSNSDASSAEVEAAIKPRRHGADVPLSFAQERLWFLDHMQSGAAYHISLALEIDGPLDAAALHGALAAVVRRHEALRTSFSTTAERTAQRVHQEVRLPFCVVDRTHVKRRHLAMSGGDAALRQVATRLFDLERGPLLRAALLREPSLREREPASGAELGERHVLGLTLHHIVADGWSLGVLVREIAELYAAWRQARPARLPRLPIQYPDFALWQRETLQGERLDAELEHWRQCLEGTAQVLELPSDRPRRAVARYRGEALPVRLDATLTQRLAERSRHRGTTLYMQLLASFATLLMRLTGQRDLLVGSAIANRNRLEIEPLVGFFVNTLALRCQAHGNPTFVDFLEQTRATALDAFAHQDVPFERLVEHLAPERGGSQNPLVQVLLVVQNAPVEELALEEVALRPRELSTAGAKFDLSLSLTETTGPGGAQHIEGMVEFDTDLFDRTTALRWAQAWIRLLGAGLETPEAGLEDLPFLSRAERHHLLTEHDDTASKASSSPLYTRVARQAEARADTIALVFCAPGEDTPNGDRHVSYGELLRRSRALAAHLHPLLPRRGEEPLVALAFERSPELIAAILAVIELGAAYLPVDPADPPTRIQHLLESSRAPFLLTQRRWAKALPESKKTQTLLFEDLQSSEARASSTPLRRLPDALTYVMYSSGSTGRPKGIAVPERGLLRLVDDPGWPRVGPELRVGHMASLSFDVSMLEIWTPLVHGGLLIGIDRKDLLEPERLFTLIERHRVSATSFATALLNRLAGLAPECLAGIDQLGFGGEAADVERLRDLLDGVGSGLLNFYGPTESTVNATSWKVEALAADAHTVPIGRPLDSIRALVLDRRLRAVPLGVVGQLYLGGTGLARGYLHRPALTAERFRPDPFADGAPLREAGGRLYATGDLVRRQVGGELVFLGRTDFQVKLRGFRIELGEIEATLARRPGVGGQVVLADGEGSAKRLVAYVRPAPGAMLDPNALRTALGEDLPTHMVPTAWVILDSFPVGPTGKVDRAALARQAPAPDAAASSGRSASGAVEETLAAIFAGVLRRDRVGAEESFFDLGGHSLDATRAVARIRDAFGVALPLPDFFNAPTVVSLARAVLAGGGEALPPVSAVAHQATSRLSFAQERLWVLDRMRRGSAYNMAMALELDGDLDAVALRASLRVVAQRHAVLRTVIEETDDGPVQRPRDEIGVSLGVVDLAAAPDAQQKLLDDLAERPFDLAQDLPMRAVLVRLAPARHVLALTLHHIAADGWSLGVLVREVRELYAACQAERRARLPELSVQYADFASWQRRHLTGAWLEKELEHWRAQLEGAATELELPTDRPRPTVPSFRGEAVSLLLPSDLVSKLGTQARDHGVTFFMQLFAAFGALLARLTGQGDLLAGSVIANRGRLELEPLIGFFVNTLALRCRTSDDPSFATHLARVRATTLDAYTHQDVPFDRLVEHLAPERGAAHNPLVQVLLVVQNAAIDRASLDGKARLGDVEMQPLRVPSQGAKFDLTWTFGEPEPGADGTGEIEFDTDLFDRTTVERWSRAWVRLLAAALEAPETRLSELSMLAPAERHQLLTELDDTAMRRRAAAAHPEQSEPSARLIDIVARQAERRPDATALVFGRRHLSYATLLHRAEILACELRPHLAPASETLIALALERSPELVVAILATLRAGAAYLPVDPTDPPSRVAFLLEDAKPTLLLTLKRWSDSLPDSKDCQRLEIDTLPTRHGAAAVGGSCSEAGEPVGGPEALAYVMYTSGSTGRPKGIAIPERGILRLVRDPRYVDLDAAIRVAHLANTAFDASTFELWAALVHGGTLVGFERNDVLEPSRFLDLLHRERADTAFFTSALFNRLAQEDPTALGGMRQLLVGGEAVDPRRAREVLEAAPPTRLLNGYGPTEATTFAVTHHIAAVAPEDASVPIGRPIDATRAIVLDRRMQPLPLGAVGQLWLGGDGLARGYLRRPALTAERFAPDPLADEVSQLAPAGGRLYATGDLVRRRGDGVIDYIGRTDFQVKLRGFRIELGEIEAALAEQPGVGGQLVMARATSADASDKRLVAYLTPEDSAEPGDRPKIDVAVLRDALAQRLPAYMVPSAWLVLETFPLTATGKVNRAALDRAPLPTAEADGLSSTGRAPAGPLEETVAAILADVLGRASLGAEEDFFALGGHSLDATRAVSRIRRALGVELALPDFFTHPNVASLAQILSTTHDTSDATTLPPISAAPRGETAPLSFAQERLWVLDRMGSGAAYHVAAAFEVLGALDGVALRAALTGVLRRHEALRVTFEVMDEQPMQRVHPAAEIPFTVVELDRLALTDLELGAGETGAAETGAAETNAAELDRARNAPRLEPPRRALGADLRRMAERPFNLERDLPLRAVLFRLAPRRHVLALTLHHIVSDGWSLGVLVGELGELYAAHREGRPARLPKIAVQYPDFALWQRRHLGGTWLKAELDHWHARLDGAPTELELPTDRPRPVTPRFRGDRIPVNLGRELSTRLAEHRRREGLTLFMQLLAAFDVLMARLSGQDDLLVGSAIANRNHLALEPLIGFFVNTLVLRCRINGDPGFSTLLDRVRATTLDAFAHQDLPFDRLVESLAPERSSARNPLVQVLLVVQNAPLGDAELDAAQLRPLELPGSGTKFDLTWTLDEPSPGHTISGAIELDTDLFDRTTAERWSRAWVRILSAALEAPETRLSELPMLAPAECHQLLIELDDTGIPSMARGEHPKSSQALEHPARLIDLVIRQATLRPDATALVFGRRHLSYSTLLRRAELLAEELRPHLAPAGETLVALALERSPELVVAILATLRAGAAYLPVDPTDPPSRVTFLLEDAKPSLLLTLKRWSDSLPDSDDCQRLEIDSLITQYGAAAVDEPSPGPGEVAGSPEALTYIMYTSGSTGRPKGIAIPERGILRLVRDPRYVDLDAEARVAHLANTAFDASTFELWAALVHGGTLIGFERNDVLEPPRFLDLLRCERADTAFFTTALFNRLVQEDPAALTGLRQLLVGGEAVDPRRMREAHEAAPHTRLFNVYGPTEATTFALTQRITKVAREGASVPIGRPIDATRTVILDRRMQPLPLGALGQLWLGGDGLARGYLRRPALTAERFVPDPLADGSSPLAPAGGRLYATGDLVRRLGDGAIDYVGRTDFQVKLRGFRIELGEIEAALAEQPGVGGQLVMVRAASADAGDKRLVAYLTPEQIGHPEQDGGPKIDVAALRDALAQRLPAYMVPSAWVVLETFPLTATGKIDRAALDRAPLPTAEDDALASSGHASIGRAPAGLLEETVATILADVLGRASLGAEEDFFALGGHSLDATRAVSRIRDLLDTELALADFFASPTVAGLARVISDQTGSSSGLEVPPIEPVARDRPIPLTFAQERLWFLDRLDPEESRAYNVPTPLRFAGVLEPAALEAALTALAQRHETLRTTFTEQDGKPRQRIAPASDVVLALPCIDLAALDASARDREMDRLARDDAEGLFDLARGPLVRATLVHLGTEQDLPAGRPWHALLLTMHHIVTDGWSMAIVVEELSELYRAAVEQRPARLAALAVQYADLAVWQRERLGPVLDGQLAWWRERLAEAPPTLELPVDRPRAAASYRAGQVLTALGCDRTERLEQRARELGATPFMVLLAALGMTLSRLCGQDDLVFGSPIANRNRLATERLIGMLVNTLALRADLSGKPTFTELVARIRSTTFGAYAHQDLPFDRLVEELQPERELGQTPLFRVFFSVPNMPQGEIELQELTLSQQELPVSSAVFDLSLTCAPRADASLEAIWLYRSALFDSTTIQRLARHHETLLDAVLDDPSVPITELAWYRPAERHQVVVEWSGVEEAHARSGELSLIPEMILQHAVTRPDAIAVWEAGNGLSYGALDQQSLVLARSLVARGIGREDCVGLALERSVDWLVALLAILRAGAVCVPIDPAQPARRLRQISEDASLVAVIGQAALPDELPRIGLPFIVQAAAASAISASITSPDAPLPTQEPEALAYVIFTSGSTGRPKGVAVAHRVAAAHIHSINRLYALGPSDRVLQYASFTFDASFEELFATLACGATLVLRGPDVWGAREVIRVVHDQRLTKFDLPPAMASTLVDEIAADPPAFEGFRLAIFGGDILPVEAARAWPKATGNLRSKPRLINSYGPTEAVVTATTYTVDTPLLENMPQVPIGRAIPGRRLVILDPRGHCLPIGAPGELCLGSPILARGYLGDPRRTAERFIPDDGATRSGGRLYRCGDLARLRADGVVDFLGRMDRQVKIRGFRIELGEIEAALGGLPGVAQGIADVRDDTVGGPRLVGYVVLDPAAEIDSAAFRDALDSHLPTYMVPTVFVAIPEIPLTSAGKIDRKALARLDLPAEPSSGPSAPRTVVEEILATIWTDVLGGVEIGPDSDFFALGGHSLLATQVVARVLDACGVEVPLRVFFEASTLRKLAEQIEIARAAETAALPPIQPVPRPGEAGFDERFPDGLALSFAQERLWFLDRLDPGGSALNMPMAVRLEGTLKLAPLGRALRHLVERHEILRTTFLSLGGQPHQRVASDADAACAPRLAQVDLSGLAESVREEEAARCQALDATTGFDLEQGPLARFAVAYLEPGKYLLIVNTHHIISDGWSLDLVISELMGFYSAECSGKTAGLAPLSLQYADYAAWQRQALAPVLEGHLVVWRRRLEGAPPLLELPLDRPRPARQTYRGALVSGRLDAQLAEPLRALAMSASASLFMVLLAAFKLLLRRLSGQNDLVVGTPVAGRGRSELEGILGCFLNNLALRTELDDSGTFEELIAQVRGVALEAYDHQDVPFERVLDAVVSERVLSHTPLFQVFFNMINLPVEQQELPGGLRVLPAAQTPVESKFDITVYLNEPGDGSIAYNLVYNADLFDRGRIEEMTEQYARLLEQAGARPSDALGTYSLLSEAALRQLPDPSAPLDNTWRGTVGWFAARHAERAPDTLAIASGDGEVSYRELLCLARALAARLQRAGVGRGDVVSVLAQRTAALPWVVLGVLEAGAAFSLLDPVYPESRLAELLELAGTRLVVELPPPQGEEEALRALAAADPATADPAAADPAAADPAVGADNITAERSPLASAIASQPRLEIPQPSAWESWAAEAGEPREVEVGPDDLAYVAFTSGSTGTPKGIRGRHGSLTHFTPAMAELYDLSPADRFSMLSGLAHDPLQRDILTPFQIGASVVVPDGSQMLRAGYLADWLRREKITVANLTPAMAQVAVEPSSDGEPPQVPDLRIAFLVGDALTRRDAARLVELAPNVVCVNHYGSTETQRAVSYHRTNAADLDTQDEGGAQVMPLGRGYPAVQLLVRRPDGGLCGIGEVGEIGVRSPHVALGYLDAEETSQRFEPNPLSGDPADRIYRTGDLGRYLPNGEVSFAGRADQQVKIRGFRIELGEIEAVLQRRPDVAEAVVVLRRERAEDPYLAAFVVPRDGTAGADAGTDAGADLGVDSAILRTALAGELPAYMVPAVFRRLEALPLTPNGKLDRAALAKLPVSDPRPAGDYAPPSNELESRILSLWKEVLGRSELGVDDNFFDAGGHSLLLVRMHSRLEQLVKRPVPLVELFRYPNVRGLAAWLESSGQAEPSLGKARDRGARQRQAMRRKRPRLGPPRRRK